MPVPNYDFYTRSDSSSSSTISANPVPTTYANLQYIHTTVQEIDQIANEDVEMQAPSSEGTRFLVIDTNVLLDHLEVLKTFVEVVKALNLPVAVVIPGIVIQELDRQKENGDRRAKLARHASSWLLAAVKERQIVKGQANDETCKSSGNWKLRGNEEIVQSNDDLVLDCCQYYSRQQLRTYLCTADVNLRIGGEIAERDGHIQTISPPYGLKWSSMAIFSVIFDNEPDVLDILKKWPETGNRSDTGSAVPDVSEDNSMDVDVSLSPSHPLDQLHEQVIAEFSKLLDELVLRVAGREIHVAVESMYAPEWRQKPFSQWTPELCLKYLNGLRKVQPSRPEAGVFLTLPHSRSGVPGRRGQDWPREAWNEVIKYLTRLGAIWEDTEMQESLGKLEFEVEERFGMKMRPTGT